MTEREQFEVEFVKLNYQWSDANKDKAFLGWQMARAQPQQAEAVPPDVVRDAERYRWLAARPNEWRLFRKHGKHKLPFRMMRDGDPWGQSFASADEAIDAAIAQQKGGV